jgi:hypothetical protein
MCHKVGGGSRPSPLPPMTGITSPESNNNTQRRNPLDEVRDTMEGRRAKPNKVEKPDTANMLERVQGIISDFVERIRKTMPSAPAERPSVTPR